MMPLPVAIRTVANRWRDECGIGLRCEIDPGVDLSLRARYEAVAICSEALTNVARHANAMSVWVGLIRQGDAVVLRISDDGRGFHMTSTEDLGREGHYGLLGLQERTERVGGKISVASHPGRGTTITVELPVDGATPGDLSVAGVA